MSESAIGVKTLAGLAIFIGLVSILKIILRILGSMPIIISISDILPPFNYELISIYLGLLCIFSGIGLAKIKRWGWIIGVIISPFAIIIDIIIQDWLFVNIYLLFNVYLLQKPIRNTFKKVSN